MYKVLKTHTAQMQANTTCKKHLYQPLYIISCQCSIDTKKVSRIQHHSFHLGYSKKQTFISHQKHNLQVHTGN